MDLTVRINEETNQIEGDVPDPLNDILKRVEGEALTRGRGEGIEQAAKDAKSQIESAVAQKAKELEAQAPYEKARLSQLESDNASLASKLAELTKEQSDASKALKEAHAEDIIERTKRIEAREGLIKKLTARSLRGEALQAGAREESLDELELILSHYVGYDQDMEPFIKGPDGQPIIVQGTQQSINSFVKDYLEKHPHHRRPPTAYRPGRARHGVSLTDPGQNPQTSRDAAVSRIEGGDRSAGAIDALFKATRKQPTG